MAGQGHDDAERRSALEQFRVMRKETADPLAARLMREIISELDAEAGATPARKAGPRD